MIRSFLIIGLALVSCSPQTSTSTDSAIDDGGLPYDARVAETGSVVDGSGSDSASNPKAHRVDVFLLTSMDTCIIGDSCTQSTCAGLFDDDSNQTVSFEINYNFRAVPKGSPEVDAAQQSACMNITISPERVLEIRAMLESFVEHVAAWTDDTLILDLVVHEIGPATVGMTTDLGSKWSGFWIDAPEAENLILPYLTKETDFIFVVNGIKDPSTGYHYNPSAMGWAVEPGLGVAGASYAWVEADSASEQVFMHEWMHLLYSALHEMSHFEDSYLFSYPACGEGDPKTTSWFPDMHDCFVDPDYEQCISGGDRSCAGDLHFAEHILRVHWPRDQVLVANACQSDDPLLKLFQNCL